jgi:hypothetical protein
MSYVAIYDYAKADSDEVGFDEGDALAEVVTSQNEGWLIGTVVRTGERGSFPESYVEASQEPAPVTDASSSAAGATVQVAFALSESERAFYNALWETVSQGAAAVDGKTMLEFLVRSHLAMDVLGEVWNLADAEVPKGGLSNGEFFNAMKLVAVAQAGLVHSVANLSMATGLPKFDGVEWDPGSVRSPAHVAFLLVGRG